MSHSEISRFIPEEHGVPPREDLRQSLLGALEASKKSVEMPQESVAEVFDPAKEIPAVYQQIQNELIAAGVSPEKISAGEIRLSTVLYLVYWFHRLEGNAQEQARITTHFEKYIGDAAGDALKMFTALLSQPELQAASQRYVENLLVPQRTVDLVITPENSQEVRNKQVLCVQRDYYPLGLALPGGFVKDTDEDNELQVSGEVFAALRVAGEKVLDLQGNAHYERSTDQDGKPCLIVRGESQTPAVRLYAEDDSGYRFRENMKWIYRPSDPRHIVDTIGFKCEIIGEPSGNFVWQKKSEVMRPENPDGGFAFGHHREIVAQITSQTSLEKEKQQKERDFIRSLINEPLENFKRLSARFEAEGNRTEVSFPELFPVVDRLLTEMFSDEINEMCKKNRILIGLRDKAVVNLRQVTLKNRVFCPYLPTLHAIAGAVGFFDVIAREKKGFYETVPADRIIEHNPRQVQYASYHMYRYKYRYDQLVNMVPHEIIIPSFEPLSATDLLKVRGVPIRFIGISTDFLYVDEFEQSPEEFYMHDANHTWRMISEDKAAVEKSGKSREALIEESAAFVKEYLSTIKILKTDTEEEREMKKLKKIILFEIVHEDARPFLKDVICQFVQQKEGSGVSFEVPRIDPHTEYMDVVDTVDTGISTLSYVRNKLQHGFYDQVDAQLPQIVDPKYRTSRWIAKAAYEMLVELGATPEPTAELDDLGNVSFGWLLKRTIAAGPDNIHDSTVIDEDVDEYGNVKINPKRYQANESSLEA